MSLRTLKLNSIRSYHVIDNDSMKMTRFPGGYLDHGGNAFYYLTDYQGNNIAVVDAVGFITQRTYYYPYGEPWRYPAGQQYLYSDKELTRADGRHAYAFPARTLLSNLPRWTTPDPLAEQTPWDSPYAYCAANPIANIDPSGLKFTPESEVYLNFYESNYKHILCVYRVCAALLSGKPDLPSSFRKILNELEAIDFELQILKSSNTIYQINLVNTDQKELINGRVLWNYESERVDINIQNLQMDILAHEMNHAYQFEIGEISLGNDTGEPFCDKVDEISAYGRSTLFGGENYSNNPEYQGLAPAKRGWHSNLDGKTDPSRLQKLSNDNNAVFKINGIIYTPNTNNSEK